MYAFDSLAINPISDHDAIPRKSRTSTAKGSEPAADRGRRRFRRSAADRTRAQLPITCRASSARSYLGG